MEENDGLNMAVLTYKMPKNERFYAVIFELKFSIKKHIFAQR